MTQKSMSRLEKRGDLKYEVLSRDLITRILGTVAYDKAFFFYADVGKPTGDFAVSLSDFGNKINSVGPESLNFHFKRGDFENWIGEVIGDHELAGRMKHMRSLKGTFKSKSTMKRKLHAAIKDRVAELQDLWRHALTWPESVIA